MWLTIILLKMCFLVSYEYSSAKRKIHVKNRNALLLFWILD